MDKKFVQLHPPIPGTLTNTDEQLEEGLQILEEAIESVYSNDSAISARR